MFSNDTQALMISLLAKFFIKDNKNFSSQSVRTSYGFLCGISGVAFNVLLFVFKLLSGIISGSVAVMADAFNNLSDAGSSIVTLFGFKLSSQEPDKEHPFGHGRFEYISGLVVSFIILLMGFELAKTSVEKIISPEEITLSPVTVAVLLISIAVKLYMAYYNRVYGKKIKSSAMSATSVDSLSDSVATLLVLVSMIISHYTGFMIDGYCGLAVAVFIFIAGINAAKETISPLLGTPPSKEFVDRIFSLVMSYPAVIGIHDLVVHDYGPGRLMISLHAEVDENANLLETHDMIDNIEKHLSKKLGCSAVIHMDPISRNDAETEEMKNSITAFSKEKFGDKISLHDFRMVKGNTHTNLIFDIVVPYEYKLSDSEIKEEIIEYLKTYEKRYFAVITVDRSYI